MTWGKAGGTQTTEVRLSAEEWIDVANFLAGLASLVDTEILSETPEHAERSEAKKNLRKVMDKAIGAVLYVAEYAAEECVFEVRENGDEAIKDTKVEDV